jgi:hypothetical protein
MHVLIQSQTTTHTPLSTLCPPAGAANDRPHVRACVCSVRAPPESRPRVLLFSVFGDRTASDRTYVLRIRRGSLASGRGGSFCWM